MQKTGPNPFNVSSAVNGRPLDFCLHRHPAAEMWTTMKKTFWGKQFLSCSFNLHRFRKYVSYGFPIINFFDLGVHYETPCMILISWQLRSTTHSKLLLKSTYIYYQQIAPVKVYRTVAVVVVVWGPENGCTASCRLTVHTPCVFNVPTLTARRLHVTTTLEILAAKDVTCWARNVR
jgi:hypothetical protein